MKNLIILLSLMASAVTLPSCEEAAAKPHQKNDGIDDTRQSYIDDSLANVATEERLSSEVRELIALLERKIAKEYVDQDWLAFEELELYQGRITALKIREDGGSIIDFGADGFSSTACIDCEDYDSYHKSIYLDQKVLEKRKSRLGYFKAIQMYKAKLSVLADLPVETPVPQK